MQRKHVRFPGTKGGMLAGRLEAPDGDPLAYALFAHCFTCSKDLKAAGHIARALVAQGIAVLRFDFTGIGESEGELSDFSSNLDDLVAAADYLRRERQAPRLLVGHSLGGAAVIAVAARIPESRAVATIGAPFATEHLRESLLAHSPELGAHGGASCGIKGEGEERGEASTVAPAEVPAEVEIRLGGEPFRLHRSLLDDLCGDRVEEALRTLGRALLVLHSPLDAIVSIDNARRILDAAKHPKSFLSLDSADHLLTDEGIARYAGTVIAAWASRYVEDEREEVETLPGVPPREGEVLVTGSAQGFRQEILAGRHRFVSDEPESIPGGTGQGPTPYDLLLAGLGACTSMTIGMYARRKGLPVESVKVKLRHARIHAADCAECRDKDEMISRIEREIEIAGSLDDEQRARILEIANRCPVHQTLIHEIEIPTRLVESG